MAASQHSRNTNAKATTLPQGPEEPAPQWQARPTSTQSEVPWRRGSLERGGDVLRLLMQASAFPLRCGNGAAEAAL